MSASITGIWNMALSHIGDRANISDPDEQSVQAENCRLFYPLALDTTLVAHPWSFATVRERLSQLQRQSWNWQYAYAFPEKALRIVAIGADTMLFDAHEPFEAALAVEPLYPQPTRVIFCNQFNAAALYIARVEDPAQFTPFFTEALALMLASQLAGAQIRGNSALQIKQVLQQMYVAVLARATVADANQQSGGSTFIPSAIAARGT